MLAQNPVAEDVFLTGLILVSVGLLIWCWELLSRQGRKSGLPGSSGKVECSSAAEESDDSSGQPHSIASGFSEPPPIQDDEGKRAVCGLMSGPRSELTVDEFGESLQRMIKACHRSHDKPTLRIYDDYTVSDTMHDSTVTLTECRSTQFRKLRAAAGLAEDSYLASMVAQPFSGGKVEASGKSGSFFLRTHDSKFVLKTIEEHEFDALKAILPHMVLYLQEHRRSLLCRFLGAYSLDIGGRTLRFAVMLNVLPEHADEVYDLKGTTEDRWVDPATKGVMKDNNFHNKVMLFEPELCSDLTQQVLDDAEFLHSVGVMDYSLLVGISGAPGQSDSRGLTAVPGLLSVAGVGTTPHLFQLGIIDYLQRWTPKKVAAHWIKKSTLGCFHEIDTEPPAVYCKRFYKYCFRKMLFSH